MSILDRVRARPGASPAKQSSKAKAKAPAHPPSESSSPRAPENQRRSFSMSSKSSAKSSASARLSIAGVANIFLRLRQLERSTKKSPPTTCSSGESPISHPRVAASVVADAKVPLSREEIFICAGNGGINTLQLLRATRNSLLKIAKDIGANVLVDEKWKCTIHEPKHRQRGHFKVHVKYDACATRSPSACECPQPVAVDRIVNVPGLMTIIRRIED